MGPKHPKNPPWDREVQAMSPVWRRHWQGCLYNPEPPQCPCPSRDSHSCVLGKRVQSAGDEGGGGGGGGREGATKGTLCGLQAGRLLKADLLWLSCRKQMLISSRRESYSLPPLSEGEWETEFSCCPRTAITSTSPRLLTPSGSPVTTPAKHKKQVRPITQ